MAKLDLFSVYLLTFGAFVAQIKADVYPLSSSMKSSSEMVSHFVSSEVLSTTNTMRIKVYQPTVTQIRVDFKVFTLAQPLQSSPISAYTCETDKFRVLSANGADLLGFKELCGENAGQHIYVPVDASDNPTYVDLIFETVAAGAASPPTWDLEITQIDCSAKPTKDLCAPPGCLQFYKDPEGSFQSFNYNGGKGPYQGSLNYAICFKNLENMCKIVYTASKFQLPTDNYDTPYGKDGCFAEKVDPIDPLSNDYLFIPDATVGNIHDSMFCGNFIENKPVSSTAPGPKSVFFHTDKVGNEVSNGDEQGFLIKYKQSNDCNAKMEAE